ncbi:MAG TPA: hypothetical protein VGN17_22340 [Bryobacteraceae bacterium]|jgi:hypothetical protein
MKNKFLALNLLLASAVIPQAFAADTVVVPAPENFVVQAKQSVAAERFVYQKSYRAWQLSLIGVAGSQAMDMYSSYGLRELNPALAGSNQKFGNQSALIKLGVAGAMVGAEYLIVRKHPGATKLLWKLNLASAAITGATAAHNFSVR